MSTDGARWDADLRPATDGVGVEDAPARAQVVASDDLRLAVWDAGELGQHAAWAIIETPEGPGEAWLRGALNFSLGMQLGGVRGRIGMREVRLRRNGPRLRIQDRVIRVEDPRGTTLLTFRSRGSAGAAWRRPDGTVIWERVGDRRTVTSVATPDEAAFVVLAERQLIEVGLSALSFLQGL